MKKKPNISYAFRSLTHFWVLGVFLILLTACDDDDAPGGNNNLSLDAQQSEALIIDYVNVNANLQAARNLSSGIIPFGDENGFNGRLLRQGLSNLENARAFTDSAWFESCADVDIAMNEGNIAITIDFGTDGCEENGNLLKGRISETFIFSGDSLYQESVYENFSFNDVSLNGSRSAGFATGDLESGGFTIRWSENLEVSFQDGETYNLSAGMTSSIDDAQIALTGSSDLSVSGGDRYQSTINEPLKYTLACIEEGIYAPVEGTETIVLDNDSLSNFSIVIDYGSGDCDHLLEVTQNGTTSVVNIGEAYRDNALDALMANGFSQ